MRLRSLLRLHMHLLLRWHTHASKLLWGEVLPTVLLHHARHTLLLLNLLQLLKSMSLPHHVFPLLRAHLSVLHLRILLLEHGIRLARSKMCHCVRLHRSTWSGCDRSLGHACHHRTLCHLRARDTRMHTLHHRWVGSAHMSYSRVLHRVAVGKAWVSAGSHTGGKRRSHHFFGMIRFGTVKRDRRRPSTVRIDTAAGGGLGYPRGLDRASEARMFSHVVPVQLCVV